MARFILLLRGVNEGIGDYSPEQLQRLFEQYDEWVQRLGQQQQLIAAQKLTDDIRRRIGVDNGRVVDGPFAETKETVGGFFVIECQHVDEAAEIARGCPVLSHGGSVELRQIEEDCRYG